MRRLPPLGPIEAFVAAARSESVKDAAQALSLSAPALTRRIQSLEHYLGSPLFSRGGNGVRLNVQGQRLLGSLAPHLEGLSNALRDAQDSGGLHLRIAVPSLFAAQRLVPALPSLRAAHPEFEIDIDTGVDRLARLGDDIDASILIAPGVDPAFYRREIERGRIIAIASRRLRDGEKLDRPADLTRVPILLHRAMADSFDAWAVAAGLDPAGLRIGGRFDAGQLLLDAAAEGLGVALMLESHLAGSTDDRLVRLFDVAVESPYAYWFAATPAAMERRPVRIFHDWLFTRFSA